MAGCWFVSGLDDASREDLLALIGVQQQMIDELRAEVAELRRRARDELLEQLQAPSSDVPGTAGPAQSRRGK